MAGIQDPTHRFAPHLTTDDQRIRWNEINDEWEQSGLDPLRCIFDFGRDQTAARIETTTQGRGTRCLCCSPEVLLRPSKGHAQWIEIFQQMEQPFSLMVIDEAHTIADWGASIRPEFQLLNTIKRILVRKILLAVFC